MQELLTSLLAPVAGGRRYWVRAPQTAPRPYVLLQVISAPSNYHMQGASGYVPIRVQIDVYANTYTEVTAVSRQIKGILSGYVSGPIQAVFIETERDLPAADAGDVNNLFRNSIDVIIHYGEPS
ncbi:tail completion protein gp17 [Agrobacterium pusense]|uniref:tail completion protein gp17 n=1 Tax=Agrobacterium pusense TaxID=648995 RepID=UPI00244CD69F|nr:DUF3168 domain-containing protein [Agrobacterium pusense]MDH0873662.1 DUF3168 domain-containing protein [Agrobacterium pusense]